MRAHVKLLLASSNAGKLREYRAMSAGREIEIDLLPRFSDLPEFSEDAPTFAENAAGKALHYSRFTREIVFADDSGLVVPALGGAPGVRSARYAGADANDAERMAKLLDEMRGKVGDARAAKFVCVIAAARQGRMLAVLSDSAEGVIAEKPLGRAGFGYDPVFYFPAQKRTFAELSEPEKNEVSHRGKAFRKLLEHLPADRTTRTP
ncbi:MAG TPA: RdgB/HAM1 family non-canonical purine NTP pyrophosphatase [Candidatus Acidoferrales bacterium]|nr:RdgB/HAM1 family non-canonical purine NTP pyrophosphatase [Candidatus Acidoferrales bacterium]